MQPVLQVQAYMLEFLFLKMTAGAWSCITVQCLLNDVMPAFCRGARFSPQEVDAL